MDKKQTAILVVVLVLVASAIVALLMGDNFEQNEPIHQHEYSSTYNYDSEYHWFTCGCGAQKDKTEHNLINAECECGYKFNLEGHVCDYNTIKSNGEVHWYQCACGQKLGEESHKGGAPTCITKATCNVCDAKYGNTLEHEYKTQSYNSVQHWHECVCGATTLAKNHDFSNGRCDCGYKQTDITHTCKFILLRKDALKHWYECECGLKQTPENHKGGTPTCTKKAKCEECGQLYGETKTHEYLEKKISGDKYWYQCICGEKSVIIQKGPKD